jgi:hypothetical protein
MEKKGLIAGEPSLATYGMSAELRNSDLLTKIRDLSHEDQKCLIRYIYQLSDEGLELYENFNDGQPPYTVEELNARIDEAELEMNRGEGKTFSEMMNGFRKELLWMI